MKDLVLGIGMSERTRDRAKVLMQGRGKKWYSIENADRDEATVYVYDYIGYFGVEADTFVRDLNAITAATIHLRINSPGGSVFEGLAIYNALRQHSARVITHVDGIAASIASVIALAGDEVRMSEGAFFMIHNPWVLTVGNASELRKTAELLDKIGEQLAQIYVRRSDMDHDQVVEFMADDSWFTAAEAREYGLADHIEEDSEDEEAKASFDLSMFNKVPEQLAARVEKPKRSGIQTEREFEAFLRDAGGFSRAAAASIARDGFKKSKGDSDPRDEDDEPSLVAAMEQLIATLT